MGDVARVVADSSRKPIWLYPNLLSLDAPLVALVWLYIFARTWRLGYHPWEAYASLGLVVWAIYVVDRLMDHSLAGEAAGTLGSRHHFHRRHRWQFVVGVVAAILAAVWLVVTKMPMAIYKYLLLGAVLVAGYLGLVILSSPAQGDAPITKNVLAGVTFAFGTALAAHIYRPELGIYDLIKAPEFVSFAVLCMLNIAAIDLWEHAGRAADVEIKASDELALTLPLTLLGGVSLTFALMDDEQSTRPFFYAVLTASALLYVLNRRRAHLSMDALRVLADVALVAPLLVFLSAMRE